MRSHNRFQNHSQIASLRKPRLFVDASSFDPTKVKDNGHAVIIIAQNEEETIMEHVKKELLGAIGVVVLDKNSSDATPYLAAEAGAIVVLQEQGIDVEDALRKAVELARTCSDNVIVLEK
jgi:hypothetical protein